MLKTCLAPATAALTFFVLAAAPVQAATVRAWVSGTANASDVASCGAPATPCRTLQYAFTNIVAAGGEIDILDPAGYGTLIVNHAISIVNDGVGTAGVQAASGTAITINAGANDAVRLKGLNIEGLGTAAAGITFNTGGSLTVEDCTIKDFIGFGVDFETTASARLEMSGTRVENSNIGIDIGPFGSSTTASVQATLSHVEILDNDNIGIDVRAPSAKAHATVADSTVSGNNVGIKADGGGVSTFVMVRATIVSNNVIGVKLSTGATTVLDRATVTGSTLEAFQGAGGPGGTIGSYGNNAIFGNAGSPVVTTPETLQ